MEPEPGPRDAWPTATAPCPIGLHRCSLAWNNYFLPLAVLSDTKLLPVTVGLGQWQAQSTSGATRSQLWNLVVTGALIPILPLVISFPSLQKYWQGGLTMGSLK